MSIASVAIGQGVNALSTLWANQQNMAEAQRNRDFQERMWNEQNAYNSPAEQVKRLEQAGLNPNLAYGTAGSGNNPAIPQGAQSHPFQAPRFDPLQAKQMELLEAQIYKTEMEGDAQDMQNDVFSVAGLRQALAKAGLDEKQIEVYVATIENLHHQNDQIQQQVVNLKQSVEESKARVDELIASKNEKSAAAAYYISKTTGQELTNEQQGIINTYLPDKLRKELDQLDATIAKLKSENWLNIAKTHTEKALAGMYGAQTSLYHEQYKTEGEKRHLYRANAYKAEEEEHYIQKRRIGQEIKNDMDAFDRDVQSVRFGIEVIDTGLKSLNPFGSKSNTTTTKSKTTTTKYNYNKKGKVSSKKVTYD